MPGSAADPVQLDPWQQIVEVGWPTRQYTGIGVLVDSSHAHSANISCSGPFVGGFDGNLHSRNYLATGRIFVTSAPLDGSTHSISPVSGSGPSVDCVVNGFIQDQSQSFDPWAYARRFTGSEATRMLVPAGAAIGLQIAGALDSLDSNPVCRSLAIGGGIAATRTGAATAAGPTINFDGVTLTEVGGAGRVFRPVSFTNTTEEGSAVFNFIFQAD